MSLVYIGLTASTALGYWTITYGWPQGSSIIMQLELGPTNVKLEDGSGTWNGSAANALSLWNPYLESVQFEWVSNSAATEMSGDGLNSVFFSSSVFGEEFGEGTLAVTVYLTDDAVRNEEADVIVNQSIQFNSYRGPLKPGDPETKIYDIHRVFLHEFGHVLGLGHPDEHGMYGDAIMNSAIGGLDHIVADDIAGVTDLYGIKVFPEALAYFVGQPISYQVATNVPAVSYEAANLPSGLSIDPKTGIISGAFSLSGTYDGGTVTVHGLRTTGSSGLLFYVDPDPPADLRAAYYFNANELLVDAARDRIYAAVADPPGVAVIDGASLSVLKTISVDSQPFGLALSPTGTTLFVGEFDYRGISTVTGVIDLDSLTSLPNLPAAFPSRSLAAPDNRLFATQLDYPLMAQIDTVTGAISYPFSSTPGNALLALSSDLKTLYVGADGGSRLSSYDVSGASPVLLQDVNYQYPYPIGDFTLSHDGSFILANGSGSDRVLKLSASDFNVTLAEYVIPDASLLGDGPVSGKVGAISPDDSTVFVTAFYIVDQIFAFDVFDAATGKYLRQIVKDEFFPSKAVVDPVGRYLFAAAQKDNLIPQLRVHSTGSDIAPLHPPKPASLLNVSTRLQSQTGDNVLIGGFIISGAEPKQIIARGVGPSLPLNGALADPIISLYDGDGKLVDTNDNWNSNRSGVLFTGLAPADEHEAVLVETLPPGAYTAIVSGADSGAGIALVEVYDLTPDSDSALANISTRGDVELGDNVMIGGFIIGAETPTNVMIRGIGPSLAQFGIVGNLPDPFLELHGSDGDLILENDNWRSTQQADIIATGLAPTDDRESAVIATLQPGAYTAILRGQGDTIGVALVEVYNLDSAVSVVR